LVAAIGLIVAYERLGGRLRAWRAHYDYSRVLLKESWPLILAGLSVVLYMKIDVVMLGKMSGDREVGLYSAASRLSEAFYFLPMIIVSSLTPMLLRARASGAEHYRASLLKLYVLMVRLSLAIAVPFLILAPMLVEILYGSQYSESAAILQVHVWASVAVFLGVASSQYLVAEGKQKLSLYRTLVGLVINVGMNLVLIPEYGAMGAAIATLISYFVATFLILVVRDGAAQGRLMLRALNPAIVLGVRSSS
ncbi:MAG: flippase, partial [Acidobacteria bacterium]|nr:flippase [Acidobacteriota bacterium]